MPESRAKKLIRQRLGVLALALALVVACGDGEREPPLLVFAASSLDGALATLAERYEERAGVAVDVSYGGSHSLARQIAAGAPADVFVSAGMPPVDMLIADGLADADGARGLLGNRLVVVAAPDMADIDSLESLAAEGVGRIALVDPALGPAGWYAEQVLRSADLWERLAPKTILAANVRAALALVSAGSADAGIVYRTDAAVAPDLRVAADIPAALHSPIVYAAIVSRDSSRPAASQALLEYLASPEAAEVFRGFGFAPAPSR